MSKRDPRERKCPGCKKVRVLKKRSVYVPEIRQRAMSRVEMCKKCGDAAQKAIAPISPVKIKK